MRLESIAPEYNTISNMLQIAEKNFIVELKSTYGLSELRDIVTTTSGSVTHTGDEYQLSTNAVSSASVILDSAQLGATISGVTYEIGISVRMSDTPSGEQQARWGYFDGDNGAYFGQDSSGVFIAILRNGTETKIYQTSWNLNCCNDVGFILDLTKGNIFQILFFTKGYSVIEFRIINIDQSNTHSVTTVHRYKQDGQTFLIDPNQPIRAQVLNGNTATALNLFVADRYIASYGLFIINKRITSERRLQQTVDQTLRPTISFRKKSTFPGSRNNSVNIKADTFDIISETLNENLLWELYLGATLGPDTQTFSTPTNTSSSETALESNITATTISGGTLLAAGLIAGDGQRYTISLNPFTLPVETTLTLATRAINSTSVTINTALRMEEDW